MADDDWKKRIGIEINYNSSEEDDRQVSNKNLYMNLSLIHIFREELEILKEREKGLDNLINIKIKFDNEEIFYNMIKK